MLIRSAIPAMDHDTLYVLRKQIGRDYLVKNKIEGGVVYDGMKYNGKEVSGRYHLYLVNDGDLEFLSVSGHLIAQILYSTMFGTLDLRRFTSSLLLTNTKDIVKRRNHKIKDGVIGNILAEEQSQVQLYGACLLYTSPSPRDRQKSRMPSSA